LKKNIFLYVYGDDYSALGFSEKYNTKEVYESMIAAGITHKILENDEYYIEVKIKEFGEIDPEFIYFMKDQLCDYDNLKNSDIFKVEL
jgi:hypothetical protein